jgi:hypothetical protein
MLNFLNNRFKYKCLGAATVLALGLGSCEQQQAQPTSTTTAPSKMQPDQYYLNTKPSTKEAVGLLASETIVSVNVLTDQKASDYAHDAGVQKVILVQTK